MVLAQPIVIKVTNKCLFDHIANKTGIATLMLLVKSVSPELFVALLKIVVSSGTSFKLSSRSVVHGNIEATKDAAIDSVYGEALTFIVSEVNLVLVDYNYAELHKIHRQVNSAL